MKQTDQSRPWLGIAFIFLALWVMVPAGWAEEFPAPGGFQLLARVEVPGSLKDLDLPVYADLVDGAGKYYALVITSPERLQKAGGSFLALDDYLPGTRYLIARQRRPGARLRAALATGVLLDDGRHIIVRDAPGLGENLAEMGFALKLMRETPIILAPPALERRARELMGLALTPSPLVTEMIGKVTLGAVNAHISGLSGETPVMVEGSLYTISTRHTRSGTPVQKATLHVFEELQRQGLKTFFQDWTMAAYTNRNVVGELPGKTLPEDIVLLTAHLDDLPAVGGAPGADDNASGSAALLMAANIMSHYRFQRTIRFVFFTGEEQGLLGSSRYAASVAGENIVAVVNLDMIAYNTQTLPKQRLHTRTSGNPGYGADLTIANTFVDVVEAYGLAGDLQPMVTSDGETASDHSSFWDQGFAAILAIEDHYDNFNPHYHTGSDTLAYLNLAYCTAQVKASVGTAAHLARPLPQGGPASWLNLLLSWQKLTNKPYVMLQ
jgi:hypothetical protein